jgi:hypothetical protein
MKAPLGGGRWQLQTAAPPRREQHGECAACSGTGPGVARPAMASVGALGVAAVNDEASRGERRRSKKGFASTKLCRAGIRSIAQRTWAAEDWARRRARGRRCSGLWCVVGSYHACTIPYRVAGGSD